MSRFPTERVDAARVRIPVPSPGSALVVTRYRKEQAIVLHPDDFHRLANLEAALDEIAPPIEVSARAQTAHAAESYASAPLEDADQLREFLGL